MTKNIKINEPKISIIVPVYNSEKFLEKLINSIIEQTYKNYELILINDGSTDNSLKVIQDYSLKYKNIIYETIQNSGPGAARKKGFELCKGDLVFFVDSDDLIPTNDVFQKIANYYITNNFDVLFFDFKRLSQNSIRIHNTFFDIKFKPGKYDIKYLYKKPVASALWCKIFVKSKIKMDFFSNYNNYEDCYFTYKYFNNCSNFDYINEVLYFANRDNPNSLSKIQDFTKIDNTFNLLNELYSVSKCKNAIMLIVLDYYIGIRRLIDVKKYSNTEKIKIIKKLNTIRKTFDLNKYFYKSKNFRIIIKYLYYFLVDQKYGELSEQ